MAYSIDTAAAMRRLESAGLDAAAAQVATATLLFAAFRYFGLHRPNSRKSAVFASRRAPGTSTGAQYTQYYVCE